MKPLNLRARIMLLLALLLPLLLLSLHNFAQLLPMPAHSIRQLIVLQGWLPRLVISLLCGAALGLAGLLFQQTLRNPLAEPMTLGVAAGAQLALSLVTIFLPHWLVAGTQTVTLIGARRLLHQLLLAPLCGAVLLWGTVQAVQPFANALGELVPTGAATALFGAPLILWLLLRLRTASMPLAPMPAGAGESIQADHRIYPLSLALFLLLSLIFGRSPSGWAFTPLSHLAALLPWRVPREVAACAAGMMLAAAGVLLQRLTGNRLASPEMMGVSAGAALGMLALTLMVGSTSHALRLGVTTGGALVTLLIILSFSRRHHFSPDRVLLAGVTISALFQALVATVIAAGDERAITLLNWLSGSTYSIMPRDAAVAAGMALILSVLTLFFRRWLSILPLGAACAASVGVTLAQARLLVC